MIPNQKLLALFGLKWNPFSPEIPEEALITNPRFDNFFFRVENLVMDGGFAMIVGDSGLGKSVSLRMLAKRLNQFFHHLNPEFHTICVHYS
jgi:type II secretory pathway predicted ATPase ExeA